MSYFGVGAMLSWVRMLVMVVLVVGLRGTGAVGDQAGVADPNLDPFRGLDLAALAGLQEALQASGGGGGLGGSLPRTRPSTDSCSSPDSLTNLLVYQYLAGQLPEGDTAAQARSASPSAALQALLQDRQEVTTRVTVSTSLTTSTVVLDPSTRFITSTSTYTTTVTNVNTKVIPVIFRGSKVITTFSESTTEVIVATEFMTTSSVSMPTIVQTLPVHITLTATSTKGFDGYFTLADVVSGPSSVVNQPIATATVDLDATGIIPSNLDLSNVDLSQYDLSSLTSAFGNTDQGQMVDALTALLQQYGNEPPKQVSSIVSSSTRRKNGNRNGRQQPNRATRFEDDLFVNQEEPPKFNVIKGFTLSDGAPADSNSAKGSGGGSAATATRYSKYHKKPDPENNGIGAKALESDRESERYSASTSRRTFSKTNGRQVAGGNRKSPSSRFQPAEGTEYYEEGSNDRFRANGKRKNRNIESGNSRRKGNLKEEETNTTNSQSNSSKNIANRISSLRRFTSRGRPNTSLEKIVQVKPDRTVQTTVLTMFVSGTSPGDFKKTFRTVTLKSFQSAARSKRHATEHTQLVNPAPHSQEKQQKFKPEDIIKILKKLDKKAVQSMLKSLNKWVKYYTEEIMSDDEEASNPTSNGKNSRDRVPSAPILASSLSLTKEVKSSSITTALPGLAKSGATTATQASSNASEASLSSAVASLEASPNFDPSQLIQCSPPLTVTETVYHTVLIAS